jgi:hypothetical protein
VISLKSVTMVLMENGVVVAFNAEFICMCKTCAKVLYTKRFDKKTIHKKNEIIFNTNNQNTN